MTWYKVDWNLLVVKLLYFMLLGGRFTFTSFFAVFAKSYGFNTSEIGYFLFAQMAAFFFGSFFLGYLIQRTGREKCILYSTFVIVILASALLPITAYYTDGTGDIPRHVTSSCESKATATNVTSNATTAPRHVFRPHARLYASFAAFTLMLSFFQGILGPTDTVCMTFCKLYSRKRDTYDKQRSMGAVGSGVLPCVTGFLIDVLRCNVINLFRPAFAVTALASFFTMLCLHHVFKLIGKMEVRANEMKENTILDKGALLEGDEQKCLTAFKQCCSKGSTGADDIQTLHNTKLIISPTGADVQSPTEKEFAIEHEESLMLCFLKTFRQPEIILMTFINYLLGAANTVWFAYLLLLMSEGMAHSSELLFGAALSTQSLADYLASRSSAKIARRFQNPYQPMALSLLIYAAAFFATALCRNAYVMPAVGIPPGLAYAFYFLPQQHEVIRLVEPRVIKIHFAFQYGFYNFVGGGSAALLSGILFNAQGGHYTFMVIGIVLCAGFIVSALLLCFVVQRRYKKTVLMKPVKL